MFIVSGANVCVARRAHVAKNALRSPPSFTDLFFKARSYHQSGRQYCTQATSGDGTLCCEQRVEQWHLHRAKRGAECPVEPHPPTAALSYRHSNSEHDKAAGSGAHPAQHVRSDVLSCACTCSEALFASYHQAERRESA